MSRSKSNSLFLLISLVQITAGLPAYSDNAQIASRQAVLKSYPCQSCHGRSLTQLKKSIPPAHELGEFKHMNEVKNCSLCHKINNMNHLVMLDGELITLDQSPKLCGQCHGIKFREWSEGIHGKQTGHWNGEKTRFACVACHNPHNPKFKPMSAKRAPHFPKQGVLKQEESPNE